MLMVTKVQSKKLRIKINLYLVTSWRPLSVAWYYPNRNFVFLRHKC